MPKSASRIWQRWCVPSSFPTVQPLLEMGRYGFLWFFNGFIDQIGMITHTCIYIIKHHTVYIYILYCIILYYFLWYILCYIGFYYVILYYILLYYIIFYCIILYYIILYIIIIIIILIHIRILFINYDSHHHHHHCDTDQNLWYSLCILYI